MRGENYANCASGTAHNDGDKILEAVRAQQRLAAETRFRAVQRGFVLRQHPLTHEWIEVKE